MDQIDENNLCENWCYGITKESRLGPEDWGLISPVIIRVSGKVTRIETLKFGGNIFDLSGTFKTVAHMNRLIGRKESDVSRIISQSGVNTITDRFHFKKYF